jgi:N utilization substance protein B
MINRRHIRVKVMQSFYALLQSKSDNLVREEKFLYFSIEKLYDLYVLQLSILAEVQKLAKKRLAISKKGRVSTIENIQGFENLSNNAFLNLIDQSVSLKEYITYKNLDNWKDATEYLQIILDEIKKSDLFLDYTKIQNPSFKDDKEFIIAVFKEIVAPNEKLSDYYEDQYIGWVDDIPFVNTLVLKQFVKTKENSFIILDDLYKDDDDRAFVKELFTKVALHHTEFDSDIDEKTPNWEYDRIAEMDLILIKMAMTEFLYFPSIPTKVSINEYLEIAKDYSSEKSSFFINGVLDKIEKEYKASGKIQKIGRGLI